MYDKPLVGEATDYSNPDNWLSQPQDPDKDFDLLYLYPSACLNPEAGTICTVDEATMHGMGALHFAHQATAFAPTCNLFAPWWRQVNATQLPMMTFEDVFNSEWAEPRTDVYAALDYYFENLNGGRPFFLAGHSQGSNLSYIVLADYMKAHPEYYARMVAAYCIGDSLTRPYLAANPHLKAAQCADDLGVIVSWNTEGPANKGRASLVISPEAMSINPLNWRTDDTPAGPELNLGTFVDHMLDPGMDEFPVKADAVIDLERGSVMVTDPAFARCAVSAGPGMEAFEAVFGPASYHGCDYSFFYNNIKQNVADRAAAWTAQQA